MKRILGIFALLLLLPHVVGASEEFSPGQVWSYESRPQEEASTLTVLRIDAGEPRIVHIALEGLNTQMRQPQKGEIHEMGHIPISELALRQSVKILVNSSSPLPEFESGYSEWKSAYEAGKAGYFTIPVAAIVEGIENSVQ